MSNYLRCCAGCGGSFINQMPRHGDDPFHCAPCWAKRMDGFDPKPNDRVLLIRRQSGPWSQLVVISRDDGQIVTQILGQPGQRTTYQLAELCPA